MSSWHKQEKLFRSISLNATQECKLLHSVHFGRHAALLAANGKHKAVFVCCCTFLMW
jgi:hypothetical protein